MSTVQTNTGDIKMATVLSEIGDLDQGTLVSLVLKKKGVQRGPSGARVVYDDDFVHVLVWSGFHYQALVERSFKKLHQLWGAGDLTKKLIQEVQAAGHMGVTVGDVAEAIQEVEDSLLKVIRSGQKVEDGNGNSDGYADRADEEMIEERESVWTPLEVDGKRIRGAKVYEGSGDPNNPRAPIKGTVYVDGVKLGEKVLTPAANGTWRAKQKPKTVAKNLLRSWLPIGLYVRYALEPERLLTVKVGDEAGNYAKTEGVPVDPLAVKSLFKIAP